MSTREGAKAARDLGEDPDGLDGLLTAVEMDRKERLNLGPMLGAFELEGREIEHLAPLIIKRRLLGEVFAARALQTRVNLDVRGRVAGLEGATGMAQVMMLA